MENWYYMNCNVVRKKSVLCNHKELAKISCSSILRFLSCVIWVELEKNDEHCTAQSLRWKLPKRACNSCMNPGKMVPGKNGPREKSIFPGTNFSGTIFPATNFPGTIFSGTNFSGTIFSRTIFLGDHFSWDHFSWGPFFRGPFFRVPSCI